jgi:hypothetical protein
MNWLGRAMAQAVSRRSLTAETWVLTQVSPGGIYGEESGTEISLRVFQFSPDSIIPPWISMPMRHLGDEQ